MNLIQRQLAEHVQTVQQLGALESQIESLAMTVVESLKQGKKILLFGNGGSAADAQHIAAEFTGRFEIERSPLPAIALTTDTSALTAIGNDYGYDRVFSRQLAALAHAGDVALGISTSGNSPNVIRALEHAQNNQLTAWGLSGRRGGKMTTLLGERNIVVPSESTARIQECHILLGHILCAQVDAAGFGPALGDV